MNALGTHLILDLRDCKPELLDDVGYIRQAMIGAVDEAGATIVGESFHKFDPLGVTGIIAIAESHLSIHTWPEHGYAAADIFTCGEGFRPHRAAELIITRLQCLEPTITELRRGVIPERTSTPV